MAKTKQELIDLFSAAIDGTQMGSLKVKDILDMIDELPKIWYAVFIDPRGKQYAEDNMERTVFFEFDRAHTILDHAHTFLDLARETLRKRYPEITDKATMVRVGPWGLSPQCRRTAHDSAI